MGNSGPEKKTKVVAAGIASVGILCLTLFLLTIMLEVFPPWRARQEPFSDFVQQANSGAVSWITIYIKNQTIEAQLKNKTIVKTAFPANYDIERFVKGKVDRVEIDSRKIISITSIILFQLLIFLPVPLLCILAIVVFVVVQRRKAEKDALVDSARD